MQSCLPAWPPFGFQLTPMCPYMVTVFWSDVVWQAASVSTLQLEWLSDLSGFRVSSVSRLALNLRRNQVSELNRCSRQLLGSLHVKIKQYNADKDHNLESLYLMCHYQWKSRGWWGGKCVGRVIPLSRARQPLHTIGPYQVCKCMRMCDDVEAFCPLQDNGQHYQISHTDFCSECTTYHV